MGHALHELDEVLEAVQVAVDAHLEIVLLPLRETRGTKKEIGLADVVDHQAAVGVSLVVGHAPEGEVVTQAQVAAVVEEERVQGLNVHLLRLRAVLAKQSFHEQRRTCPFSRMNLTTGRIHPLLMRWLSKKLVTNHLSDLAVREVEPVGLQLVRDLERRAS